MYQVVKRDNSIVAFNLQKITAAIKKAFDACKREYTDDIIDFSSYEKGIEILKKYGIEM